MFDRGPYIASAVAIEPTRALFLPRANLLDLCLRHPAVALEILETLARRLRAFAGLAGDLAFRSITERLARYIASAASTGRPIPAGIEVNLKLTQTQLAARVGTVRELVSRALSQLERSGRPRPLGWPAELREHGVQLAAPGLGDRRRAPAQQPPRPSPSPEVQRRGLRIRPGWAVIRVLLAVRPIVVIGGSVRLS